MSPYSGEELVSRDFVLDQPVPFDDLTGGKPDGEAHLGGVVLDQMDHTMEAAVHCSPIVIQGSMPCPLGRMPL
mgnify:CR=1 FL=1